MGTRKQKFFSETSGTLTNHTQIAYNMNMLFIETSIFTKRITESVCDEDYHKLQVHLAEHPDAGDLIRGSGGIRKIRCAASAAVRERSTTGMPRIRYT